MFQLSLIRVAECPRIMERTVHSFLPGVPYIEDLTRVVILYEIYETSLRQVTTRVGFGLSYDP